MRNFGVQFFCIVEHAMIYPKKCVCLYFSFEFQFFRCHVNRGRERERKSFLFLTIHVTRDDKLALDLGSIPQQSRNNKALKMITRNLINGNACACYTLVFVSSGVCRQCRTFYSIRNRIKRRFSSPYPDSFSLIHVLWPRWLLLLRIFRNTQNAHTETTFM